METKKIVALQALVLGIFCAMPAYAAMNPPTVEDCVERTGKTEAECKEMMESFKNRKPPEGMQMPRGERPQGNPGDANAAWPPRGENQKQTVRGENNARQNQHWRLQRIVTNVEKIIEFLKSKDIDTGTIEGNFQIFQEKVKASVLAAEKFEKARAEKQENQSTDDRDFIQARTDLQTANQDALKYYREALLPSLKSALDSLR